MNNENQNADKGTIMVDGDIFDTMINTSAELFVEITERAKAGEQVSEAEGNWANAFIEYADNLKLVTVKNNESDE